MRPGMYMRPGMHARGYAGMRTMRRPAFGVKRQW
jgi:hypothetical protein